MAEVILYQLPYSHFNEKVRWALDFKGIPHRRVSVLPGPHRATIRKLSGQTGTPVLVIDGRVISGSAGIIDEIEKRWPRPALYPSDPRARAEALEIQQQFDRNVGPASRVVVYSEILPETWFLSGLFSGAAHQPLRLLYRLAYPWVARLIRKGYRVNDPAVVSRSVEACQNALDLVATRTAATGYMVGNGFGIADMACAALLAPLVNPGHPDMHWPEPHPRRVQDLLARWGTHPGAAWVRDCYRGYRTARSTIQ